ncbi:hypothetical protein CspHIS471_0406790 [Cutaneotrichosporon sp. HIS471]|nr:hypothetical protein CspHIS471_0406790 [Cutaneotrichosporon sp. HIS471]
MPSSGSSSKTLAIRADHILVKKAGDAIVAMYNKKRPRKREELQRFKKGGTFLGAAVSGAHEDIRNFCRWVEEDFSQLLSIPVILNVNYSFAVLTMLLEQVEKHAQEVKTKIVASPEAHLHQETPEGAIQRLSIAIGCMVDHTRNCSNDLPNELYTIDWVKLLSGLLNSFALGVVPSQEVAELNKDPKKGMRLLLGDDSFGPPFMGRLLVSTQGEGAERFRLISALAVSMSMFQVVTRMVTTYPTIDGDKRLALLRKIFPPGSWRDCVQAEMIPMLHGRSHPDTSSREDMAIPGTAATDGNDGESTRPQPEATIETFDDAAYDDDDLLQALEAAETVNTPLRSSDTPDEHEPVWAAPVRSTTAKQGDPVPKSKGSKSSKAKIPLAALAPSAPVLRRCSSRSAAATSREKISAIVTAQASSQNEGPSQLDPATEPSSPSYEKTQAPVLEVVTPPQENTTLADPDIHMAESSHVVPKHHTPPKGPYTYSRKSPQRLAPLEPSPVNPATSDLDEMVASSLVRPERVPDIPLEEPSRETGVVEESTSKATTVKGTIPLVKSKAKGPALAPKSDKLPAPLETWSASSAPPTTLAKKKTPIAKKNSVRGKRSKVDITDRPSTPVDTANEDQILPVDPGANPSAPQVPAKRPRAAKAEAGPSGTVSAPSKAISRSSKSTSRVTREETFETEMPDPLPSNSPLPWETRDYPAAPADSKKGWRLAKIEPKAGTTTATKLSKGHTTGNQSEVPAMTCGLDDMDDAELLDARSAPPPAAWLPNADDSSLDLRSQGSPMVVDDDDPTVPSASDGPAFVTPVPHSSIEAITVTDIGASRAGRTVNLVKPDVQRGTSPRKRKAKAIIDLTHDRPPPPDGGVLLPDSYIAASDISASRRAISLSPSSPLLAPTSSPTETPTKSNMASPSVDSLDSMLDLKPSSTPITYHDVPGGDSTSATQVQPRKPKSVAAVDVFGDVSAVSLTRATGENGSEGNMSTSTRPTTIQPPKLKPSLRSPPLPNHEDRPSKRTRFDLLPLVERAPEPRNSAFGGCKSVRGPLTSIMVRRASKESRKLNEVHSLFTEFYDPIARSLSNKVEAPSRAMQKARRQIELSAGVTIRKWIDEGNPNLDAVWASCEQRSTLFNDHLRGVFQRANNESNKRHKRVQSLCAEGRKKAGLPVVVLTWCCHELG